MEFKKLFLFNVVLFAASFACCAKQFKVASWNILSQEPYEKYAFKIDPKKDKTPDGFIWEKDDRINKVAQQIQQLITSNQTDIICLQEINLSKKDEYEPVLKVIDGAGYAHCLFKKSDFKHRESQTTAVVYNPKTFTLSKTNCASHYDSSGGKGYSAAHLVFVGHEAGPMLTVLSVHLPFSGKNSNQQLDSLNTVLSDRTVAQPGAITIVCGDFNWTTTVYFYQNQQNLIVKDERLKGYFPKTYELAKTTLKKTFAGDWHDAARAVNKYSNPTAMQGWGTLETIDYIWYVNPTKIPFSCIGFTQLPAFDVNDVDGYFDKLVKHGYPITYQDMITAARKNTTKSRSDFLNKLKNETLRSLNDKPPYGFKPFGDFPSDHAILIAKFDIELPGNNQDTVVPFVHKR